MKTTKPRNYSWAKQKISVGYAVSRLIWPSNTFVRKVKVLTSKQEKPSGEALKELPESGNNLAVGEHETTTALFRNNDLEDALLDWQPSDTDKKAKDWVMFFIRSEKGEKE